MACRANFSAIALTFGVNRSRLSAEWCRLNSGVVTLLSGQFSLSAHRYSPDTGRRYGGVGSHRARTSAEGLILSHSANVLTRLYRNVPEDSVSPNRPWEPLNQAMYTTMGTTPARSRVTRRRQPTRLTSMATSTTASSGWPTDLTRVAYPMSRPATAMTG